MASRVISAKNDKEALAASVKGSLYSQIFKPISTARRQVTVKRIVCTFEEVEMLISINRVGRAEVMFFKTVET